VSQTTFEDAPVSVQANVAATGLNGENVTAQLLDAAGPISVFEIAARFAGQSPSIKVLAVTPGPVRSSSATRISPRVL